MSVWLSHSSITVVMFRCGIGFRQSPCHGLVPDAAETVAGPPCTVCQIAGYDDLPVQFVLRLYLTAIEVSGPLIGRFRHPVSRLLSAHFHGAQHATRYGFALDRDPVADSELLFHPGGNRIQLPIAVLVPCDLRFRAVPEIHIGNAHPIDQLFGCFRQGFQYDGSRGIIRRDAAVVRTYGNVRRAAGRILRQCRLRRIICRNVLRCRYAVLVGCGDDLSVFGANVVLLLFQRALFRG